MHNMHMAKVRTRFKRPTYRQTYIRQWREFRGLTQQALAARVGTTHATLSRLERGKHPYKQELLERIADALQTDVASLLMRDPSESEALWTIWEQAKPGERRMIVDIAKTVIKTGT